MAQKKPTQAQKASMEKTNAKAKTPVKKEKESVKAVQKAAEERPLIPLRAIAAVVYALLFILFLVIAMGQEGYMLSLVKNLTHGLFGAVAFYIAIPGMLYLFIIQAFSGKAPALLRSCCTLGFIFLCGCISHLSLNPANLGSGLEMLKNLYLTGTMGRSGGVLCGLVAQGLVAAFGRIFSYIALIITAVLCLMSACKFTIPSLIRAIQNRPRLEDEEEREEQPEPAAIVVNHLANKHISHVENKRRIQQERAEQAAVAAEQEAQRAALAAKQSAQLEE